MADLSKEILEFLNERVVGKFLDDGPSGMQVVGFRVGPPSVGSANTIYIKFKDLGWKDIKGDNYHGETEMYALNGNYQFYDSLDELAKARLKRGKRLLGYESKE
ncbi:MAG: hypothetical protein Q8N99_07140 [Nanoarchaeota archaeon]|nr:hypothetical protein [Nanoarchaeota archaeon]